MYDCIGTGIAQTDNPAVLPHMQILVLSVRPALLFILSIVRRLVVDNAVNVVIVLFLRLFRRFEIFKRLSRKGKFPCFLKLR